MLTAAVFQSSVLQKGSPNPTELTHWAIAISQDETVKDTHE
jgi:hypothetical protein